MRLYDPDLLKTSQPGDDLKWSMATIAVIAIPVVVLVAVVVLTLRALFG